MPGITNPAEEYFKDGSWAWDPAGGVWLKLIIDPLTNRLVIDHPGDIEVVQPVPADLAVGAHGWDGSAWRKLPLTWGFTATWTGVATGVSTGAGTTSATISVDEVGYVVMVLGFEMHHNNTVNREGRVMANVAGSDRIIIHKAALVPLESALSHATVVLNDNDTLTARITALANGKTVYLYAWGYKMAIAE